MHSAWQGRDFSFFVFLLAPGLAKLVQRGVYESLAASSIVVLAKNAVDGLSHVLRFVEAHDNFISLYSVEDTGH